MTCFLPGFFVFVFVADLHHARRVSNGIVRGRRIGRGEPVAHGGAQAQLAVLDDKEEELFEAAATGLEERRLEFSYFITL